jgi:cyanophycinase
MITSRRCFLSTLFGPALAVRLHASATGAAPGKLVIAGGAITSARPEVWSAMLASRLAGRPIGIISTASSDPASVGQPLADSLNEEHGADTARFIPLDAALANAGDKAILKSMEDCGGFYFTGGSQLLTTRCLLAEDGAATPALGAIRVVHAAGGVIGGSSAGAAIMSHPMISGGVSPSALRRGATPAGSGRENQGVGYAPGLGFSPGILYCQHHVERGRFGRLLTALCSPEVGLKIGFGISEDTALVVDHAAGVAEVIGAHEALLVDCRKAARGDDGAISGAVIACLTRGDRARLDSLEVRPAPGKTPLGETGGGEVHTLDKAWARAGLRTLLGDLARGGPGSSALARDEDLRIRFQRTAASRAWQNPAVTDPEAPAWTIDGIQVEIRPG